MIITAIIKDTEKGAELTQKLVAELESLAEVELVDVFENKKL